jgi:hypothetical protein
MRWMPRTRSSISVRLWAVADRRLELGSGSSDSALDTLSVPGFCSDHQVTVIAPSVQKVLSIH